MIFGVDIFSIFSRLLVWASFSKIGQIIFQSPGGSFTNQ